MKMVCVCVFAVSFLCARTKNLWFSPSLCLTNDKPEDKAHNGSAYDANERSEKSNSFIILGRIFRWNMYCQEEEAV